MSMDVEALSRCEAGAQFRIKSFKALCIPQRMPHNLARSLLLVDFRGKKSDRGQRSSFPSKSTRFAPSILITRVQHPPGSSTIELPSTLAESSAYSAYITCYGTLARAAASYQKFRDRTTCLSRAPERNRICAWEEARWVNTILNQPNHRLVSTDCLNCVDSQLTASV